MKIKIGCDCVDHHTHVCVCNGFDTVVVCELGHRSMRKYGGVTPTAEHSCMYQDGDYKECTSKAARWAKLDGHDPGYDVETFPVQEMSEQ